MVTKKNTLPKGRVQKENALETQEKKYTGYGYHGGGRPKKAKSEKTIYKTLSIAGSPEEIEQIREMAQAESKTVSRFVIDTILEKE